MKKTKKQFITWIKEQVKYYKPFLGLKLERIKVREDSSIEYMSINSSYPYIDTTIKFNEYALKDFQDGKIGKDVILHELLHILTDPLYLKATRRYVSVDEIDDEREKLTDTLSAILRDLIK